MSCPNLGTGTITATFTPLGGGDSQTNSVTFRCIEPLRKLAYLDLDRAMVLGLQMSLDELLEKGVAPHPNTADALNWYQKQGEK